MSVVTTSSVPNRARGTAARVAQTAPASAAAMTTAATASGAGSEGPSTSAAAAPATAPAMSWPSAPIDHRPMRKATVTASPVRINGVVDRSVSRSARDEPNALLSISR